MITVEKISPSTITLKCSPLILDDLIWMLEKFVSMSRYLKQAVKYAEAEERASDPARRLHQKAVFDSKSRKTYCRYRELLSSLGRSEAHKAVMKEFMIDSYTASIHISNGRKIEKEEKYRAIKKDHSSGGYSIAELAALYGASYNTIKKIVLGRDEK
ncbi:MAG: hypothetical protein A2X55_07750 [Nitrospirae bacterium GWB2_47_37]|nr:MAG: hypothetical protein A2X55_07750 [Nitrospirae bacterium GWB2_47_37]